MKVDESLFFNVNFIQNVLGPITRSDSAVSESSSVTVVSDEVSGEI